MGTTTLVGFGLFILFAVPALVAASDRRRTHALFHAALMLSGLAWALATGGTRAVLLALASGGLILVVLACAVALTQRRWQRRPLSGGEVQFMTASATWLMPVQALLALVGATLAIIAWSLLRKAMTGHVSRPEVVPFVVAAVLFALGVART